MPQYENIVTILRAWKEDTQLAHEQRMFFVEPHPTQVFTYNISASIRVDGIGDKDVYVKHRSEVLSLDGLRKEIPNLEEKMQTLRDFLEKFTDSFYKKVERGLK